MIFYRKVKISTGGAACLEEALHFYRKLLVEAQNEPECVARADLMTTGWCGCMQASFGTMHDADILLHHPRHHATEIPAPANQINEFSWKNQLSEKNEHRELIPCPCRASEASGARLAGHLHCQVACTQGGETITRHPVGIL